MFGALGFSCCPGVKPAGPLQKQRSGRAEGSQLGAAKLPHSSSRVGNI